MAYRKTSVLLGCCAAVLFAGAATHVDAQAPQALVIQGATLIDGNGGAPVANSVIVIQGNRISAAGAAGQVQVPAGAQTIDARGKFVVPGLWDAQTNYSWFNGELNLNQGVTSIVDIGNGEAGAMVIMSRFPILCRVVHRTMLESDTALLALIGEPALSKNGSCLSHPP